MSIKVCIEIESFPRECHDCPFQLRFKDGTQNDWYMRRCIIKNRTIQYPRPRWCPLEVITNSEGDKNHDE